MTTKPAFLVRGYRDTDLAFLKNSFLKSLRNSPGTRNIPNGPYFENYEPLIEGLLSGSAEKFLAVDPTDPDHIYGWCIHQKLGSAQVLHYVYVKFPFRRLGIASSLLKESGFDLEEPFFYPIASYSSEHLRRQFTEAVYNPFLLLRPQLPANSNILPEGNEGKQSKHRTIGNTMTDS